MANEVLIPNGEGKMEVTARPASAVVVVRVRGQALGRDFAPSGASRGGEGGGMGRLRSAGSSGDTAASPIVREFSAASAPWGDGGVAEALCAASIWGSVEGLYRSGGGGGGVRCWGAESVDRPTGTREFVRLRDG